MLLRFMMVMARVIEIRVSCSNERGTGVSRSTGKAAAVPTLGRSVRRSDESRTIRVAIDVPEASISRAAAVEQRLKRMILLQLLLLLRSAIGLAADGESDSAPASRLRCGNAADGRSIAGSEAASRKRRIRGRGLVQESAANDIRWRHHHVKGAG